jgi:hypothetical protein
MKEEKFDFEAFAKQAAEQLNEEMGKLALQQAHDK